MDAVSVDREGHPLIEELTTSECWALLQDTNMGRLAVTRSDNSPDIFPVNFLTHEGSLYIRTAQDVKLHHLAHHPVAAFEIDGETDDAWWSVVVRGPANRVPMDAEVQKTGIAQLVPVSPTRKEFVIKVTASVVTGRRIPKQADQT